MSRLALIRNKSDDVVTVVPLSHGMMIECRVHPSMREQLSCHSNPSLKSDDDFVVSPMKDVYVPVSAAAAVRDTLRSPSSIS